MKYWPTLLLMLLLTAAAPVACSAVENPTSINGGDEFEKKPVEPHKLLVGQWEHISYTDNKNNREIPLGMIGVQVTTTFDKNGTYTTVTNKQSGKRNESGFWSYDKKNETIVLKKDQSEDGVVYNIKQLDERSMVMEVVNRTTKMKKVDL